MFDVSLGRSAGIQIQAISRSGANARSGSVYGFFQDTRLNAKDTFVDRVVPYANQQLGVTAGGPLIKDKLHYFGSYEYEREPQDIVVAPEVFEGQSMQLRTLTGIQQGLARFDYQLSSRDRFLVRGVISRRSQPLLIAPNEYPTRMQNWPYKSYFVTANWTRVLRDNLVHEARLGHRYFQWFRSRSEGVPATISYVFPGLAGAIGPHPNFVTGQLFEESKPFARYDLTWHRGRHDVKLGGEVILGGDSGWWMDKSFGTMFFSAAPPDMARRFPLDAWNDPSRWDLSGLDHLALRFERNYARLGGQKHDRGDWSFELPRPTYAVWFNDSWQITDRFTASLGLRYDLSWGDLNPPGINETDVIVNNGLFTENVGFRNGNRDTNNIAPRVGFAWDVTGDGNLVIRGGSGLFYAVMGGGTAFSTQLFNGQRVITNSYANDGRPGFVADPTRGITEDDVLSGRATRVPLSNFVTSPDYKMAHMMHNMIGFQKQWSDTVGFGADLIYRRGYDEESGRHANVAYDPATGYNKHPRLGLPNPDFGLMFVSESLGRSEHLALATQITRRYRNNFQLLATYTAVFFSNDDNRRYSAYGCCRLLNPFDSRSNWGRANDLQRHTVRSSGIWTLPRGFSLSGLFKYGSGNYSTIDSGINVTGVLDQRRLRRDFSVIPRNSFPGDAQHGLDLRLSKEFSLPGGVKLQGMAELFNVYNYQPRRYNTIETSANFGKPIATLTRARAGQLGFRVGW